MLFLGILLLSNGDESMKTKSMLVLACVVVAAFVTGAALTDNTQPVIKKWYKTIDDKKVEFMTIDGIMVHERDPKKQPFPKVVRPGELCCDKPTPAPSDAVVLFDGTKESFEKNWTDTKDNKSKWKFIDGALESVEKAGQIQSVQKFGSCQLHIEWASPAKVKGRDQSRGNSGVFIMGTYEIQVLDSYKVDDDDANQTYPDGQAGALYGRKKPLVNACRKPGQWQSFDVIFHRPIFDKNGKVVRKATFIVLQNGVLIHDYYELTGGTGWRGSHSISEYATHADKLPLRMQDHGNPVRFRNIWVRELQD